MSIRELDSFGKAQHGLVTREQVLLVKSQSTLDYWINVGELVAVHRGVYRFIGAAITRESLIMAAVLASPSGSIASHHSAASLHRLNIPNHVRIHVTVPESCSRQRRAIVLHSGHLAKSEITTVDQIPCSKVGRTIVDLAGVLDQWQLSHLIDRAVIDGKVNYETIEYSAVTAGKKGRKGIAFLMQFLAERTLTDGSKAQSEIQLKVVAAAALAGLPKPELEFVVPNARRRYQLDVAWPSAMLGAEADGFNVHGKTRVKFDEDRQRHNEISGLGWTLLHFTHRMSEREIASRLLEAWTLRSA